MVVNREMLQIPRAEKEMRAGKLDWVVRNPSTKSMTGE